MTSISNPNVGILMVSESEQSGDKALPFISTSDASEWKKNGFVLTFHVDAARNIASLIDNPPSLN
jgi:hypothetical protein